MRNGTVKEFLDALEEMHSVYPYEEEETEICTRDMFTNSDTCLSISTVDKKTGVRIHMSKDVKQVR